MTDQTKKSAEKPKVWLSYRSSGSSVVHRLSLSGVQANRLMRKLNKTGRLDFLTIEGSYEAEVKEKARKEAKIHIQVAQSQNWQLAKQKELLEDEARQIIEARVRKTGRITTTRMSFQIGRLDQSVILLCPVTGIIGKLEMPYAPVALNYEHPLSKPGNVLALLRYHFSLPGQQAEVQYLRDNAKLPLDRQTIAGCLLSLLRGKYLLKDEEESSAAERNMVIQNAGYTVVAELCKEIVRVWDNLLVWKRMPKLSVEWKTHSEASATVAEALQNYLKILKSTLDPVSGLTKDEQTKLFEASRSKETKPKSVRIYSASAVEHRKIKTAKIEARDLFEILKPHLSLIQRTRFSKVITNLLLLPATEKKKAATELRSLFIGKPQGKVAHDLATALETTSNESILSELGTLSMEVHAELYPNLKPKSISEILEAKRQGKEAGESQEGDNNGSN